MRPFEEFWWASAMARMDTRDSQAHVLTRGIHGVTRTVPPEEVTTFNLVRRLAYQRHRKGGVSIALHSRPLEGGNIILGRPPSGADLELAVEVHPGQWLDISLQAKKFNPASGKYDGWNPAQNGHLMSWAASKGRRSTGVLLYNTSDAPFCGPGKPSLLFQRCCSPVKCHGWRWSDWTLPTGASPLAIGIVIFQPKSSMPGLTNPFPATIALNVMPLECIFCPSSFEALAASGLLGTQPEWAASLLFEPDLQRASQVRYDDDDAAFSLVLGMSDEER